MAHPCGQALLPTATALLGLTLLAPAADWPQFLGPARDGTSTEKGLLATWPKKGPKQLWEKKVGEGFSGPVVAGSYLVLFHRIKDNEVVEALDPATGKQKWHYDYPTGYRDAFRA